MTGRPAVFTTRVWPQPVLERLAATYDLTVNAEDAKMSGEALSAAMRTFDAVCPTPSEPIDARVLGPAPRVRIIGNYGVGYDNIDVAACQAAGVVATNTPEVLTEATAELALLLMLMVARRAGEGERLVRSGGWTGWGPTHMLGMGLAGRTLGLIGFGRIARALARKAHAAFAMPILYHSPSSAPPEVQAETGAVRAPSLHALLAASDVVSLHCPSTPQTRHLIDARALAAMKPSALLINTARGAVVDEAALAEALATRRIAGAGLDVYVEEPVVHAGLTKLQNAVLLPHLGSATWETRIAMGMRVADNLDAFFDGREPPDRVA